MDDPGAVSLWLRCTSFSAMQSSPLFVISFIGMGSIIDIAMDIVAYGEGVVNVFRTAVCRGLYVRLLLLERVDLVLSVSDNEALSGVGATGLILTRKQSGRNRKQVVQENLSVDGKRQGKEVLPKGRLHCSEIWRRVV